MFSKFQEHALKDFCFLKHLCVPFLHIKNVSIALQWKLFTISEVQSQVFCECRKNTVLPWFSMKIYLVWGYRHTTFPYHPSKQWEQDMLECVKHGFQVCRCPAHSHTYTHRQTRTCAGQLLRYAESKKAASTSRTASLSVCQFSFFFSIFSFLLQCFFIDYPSCLPLIFSTLSSGWQIQLPVVALTVFDGVL